MKKSIFKFMAILCFTSIFLTSCSTADDTRETRTSLLKSSNPSPIAIEDSQDAEQKSQDIKETALSLKEVYDVAVVKGKDDCLVAFKVHHLQRFRMKKIEQELQRKLENQFNEEKFTVSSDYKIFLEAIRLNASIDKNTLSEEEKEQRLQDIIKLSEEKT